MVNKNELSNETVVFKVIKNLNKDNFLNLLKVIVVYSNIYIFFLFLLKIGVGLGNVVNSFCIFLSNLLRKIISSLSLGCITLFNFKNITFII